MAALTTSSPDRRVGAAPHGLRLTRRGRVVVTLLLLAIVTCVLTLVSARSVATADPGMAPAARTVVIERGDTLWDIAAEVAGPGETREVIHEIQRLNSLAGPELVEGQVLSVPLTSD